MDNKSTTRMAIKWQGSWLRQHFRHGRYIVDKLQSDKQGRKFQFPEHHWHHQIQHLVQNDKLVIQFTKQVKQKLTKNNSRNRCEASSWQSNQFDTGNSLWRNLGVVQRQISSKKQILIQYTYHISSCCWWTWKEKELTNYLN